MLISLRSRLNLLITLSFALILLLGISFVINRARLAVQEEVSSTANLTLQLVEIALQNAEVGMDVKPGLQQRIVNQIAGLGETRHLHLEIRQHGAPVIDGRRVRAEDLPRGAPDWFVNLIGPEPKEFRRKLVAPGMPDTEIIIRADPIDEIVEAWGEARVVLFLLALFVLSATVLVYITIGRGLAPIDNILKALDGIEQGDYRLRLPQFNLPELSRISDKFNHMAAVLQRSRDENRTLTQRSMAIQEQERRNLAHELHDELGQSISAIKAVAASINHQDAPDNEQIEQSKKVILSITSDMHEVARQMMRRLRPVVLDELGLVVALQEMIDDWNARNEDMFCRFSHHGDLTELGEAINISLYRIVQESLTNTVRHSGASEVHVEITRDINTSGADRIRLQIHDNGQGFAIEQTRWGLGLLGMRERAEALNGKFSLFTEPGKGVSIDVMIPLSEQEVSVHD